MNEKFYSLLKKLIVFIEKLIYKKMSVTSPDAKVTKFLTVFGT